jgi:hypothetical protein
METYHKIQTLFKRHQDGPKKGKMILGDWTTPELEYLKNAQWEFTEKVDGTNIRIHLHRIPDGKGNHTVRAEYGGRTDKAVLPKPLLAWLEENFPTYPNWRREITAPAYTKRYNEIVSWMVGADLEDVILFGEGYGPSIQGGGKYREDQAFVLFDVKIGDWWLSRENVNDIAETLGVESVPVLGYGTLQDAIDIVSSGITFNESGAVVRWGRGTLFSQWGNFEAEGIVARPKVALFDRKGERIITKIKAVDFK